MNGKELLKENFEYLRDKSFEIDVTSDDKADFLQLSKNQLVDLYFDSRRKFKKYHRYGETMFAIAELDKVRDTVENMLTYKEYKALEHKGIELTKYYDNLLLKIDQQIKELKDKLNENKN